MDNTKLTIDLSDDMLERIKQYQSISRKKDIGEAVSELINYALNFPIYFRQFDWEKAEEDADFEIASGNVESFNSVEEFISDLEK